MWFGKKLLDNPCDYIIHRELGSNHTIIRNNDEYVHNRVNGMLVRVRVWNNVALLPCVRLWNRNSGWIERILGRLGLLGCQSNDSRSPKASFILNWRRVGFHWHLAFALLLQVNGFAIQDFPAFLEFWEYCSSNLLRVDASLGQSASLLATPVHTHPRSSCAVQRRTAEELHQDPQEGWSPGWQEAAVQPPKYDSASLKLIVRCSGCRFCRLDATHWR